MAGEIIPDITYYTIFTVDKVRYCDTDRQGHVNNSNFSSFLETGRVEILYDATGQLADDGCSFVIANLNIDFIGEITWPGEVRIGTKVIKTGNSSIVLEQGIFQETRCCARATTVIVHVDGNSKKSKELGDRARERLQALQ